MKRLLWSLSKLINNLMSFPSRPIVFQTNRHLNNSFRSQQALQYLTWHFTWSAIALLQFANSSANSQMNYNGGTQHQAQLKRMMAIIIICGEQQQQPKTTSYYDCGGAKIIIIIIRISRSFLCSLGLWLHCCLGGRKLLMFLRFYTLSYATCCCWPMRWCWIFGK